MRHSACLRVPMLACACVRALLARVQELVRAAPGGWTLLYPPPEGTGPARQEHS